MSIYTILFFASVGMVNATMIDTPVNVQENNNNNLTTIDEDIVKAEFSIEEKMKELRIEMVKFQILSKLNLKEAPPFVQRPSEASKEIIRLLMKEEEEWQEKRQRLLSTEERLVIHAKKSNLRCLYTNATHCRMYHFELSQSLNTSSVDLWIYKLSEYPKWISISLASSTSSNRKQYEVLYYEVHHAGWNKLQLPKMFTPPSWNDSSYIIEIIDDFECQMFDISFCQRFEYRISWDVDPSLSEFWVYKMKPWPFNNVTISLRCSHSEQSALKQEDFPNENITMQWTVFHLSELSGILLSEENITCEIEVKGIVMDLNNLPFLKMMKNKEVRTRREITNVNDSVKDNGCKMIPFNISFEDIGFGNWILYPHEYKANTCVGYCSHVKNHHENLLMKYYKENIHNETQCDHCWFTCCRPKAFKTLEIFYLEREGVIARKNMTDMIVASCSCM